MAQVGWQCWIILENTFHKCMTANAKQILFAECRCWSTDCHQRIYSGFKAFCSRLSCTNKVPVFRTEPALIFTWLSCRLSHRNCSTKKAWCIPCTTESTMCLLCKIDVCRTEGISDRTKISFVRVQTQPVSVAAIGGVQTGSHFSSYSLHFL